MSYTNNHTAVLYFTRSAAEEARVKTFCTSGNFAQNRAIAQKLINHTHRQIQRSGLPVKVYESEIQVGRTFGEKLSNAFQSLFDEGYENVIAVGNDCAELSAKTIQSAANSLQNNPLVVGPAADGGTYLIGMNRKAFFSDSFSRLAWETGFLLEDFVRYARMHEFSLTRLIISADIDNAAALQQFLRHAVGLGLYDRLIAVLQSIISSVVNWYKKSDLLFYSHRLHLSLFHRGPPIS